jgi:predicted short-subunit dehydrogenase-like oxidoreductase (DUF2520 family)
VSKRPQVPKIAIVGAGSFAAGLSQALRESGFTITEIISRDAPRSRQRARALAVKAGARAVTLSAAKLDATLLWFAVPDREIRAAAQDFAKRDLGKVKTAFHSSGALASAELAPLRKQGIAVASVHPLMTFVSGSQPPLAGVPFALEGDRAALQLARSIVRDLGGTFFALPVSRKAAYHAWATMTSPLLLAFLVTVEQAGRATGLSPSEARRRMLPIVRQTLANYAALGPADSFSGPFIRGDVATVEKHLAALKKIPQASEVYRALARSALKSLPSGNRSQMLRLLGCIR